jgi:hypothetical protein
MSVFGLNFVKNLTRWLRFLTVLKHCGLGIGFAFIGVNATGHKTRWRQTRNLSTYNNKTKN